MSRKGFQQMFMKDSEQMGILEVTTPAWNFKL